MPYWATGDFRIITHVFVLLFSIFHFTTLPFFSILVLDYMLFREGTANKISKPVFSKLNS